MNSQLTSLPICGFIAQLVEHRTGIVEVTGSNPVEALIFFRLLNSNCLYWKFTAKITYHLHIYPQFTYGSFHIHYIICSLYRLNLSFPYLVVILITLETPKNTCKFSYPGKYQNRKFQASQKSFDHPRHLKSRVTPWGYLTIRPVARKGYGSIAHEAKPNGLLTRGP